MSNFISVATALEKNRIASDVAFVALMDVFVVDASGNPVETLSFARNSENVMFQGREYIASNFNLKLDLDTSTTPKLTVDAQDPSGAIRNVMETYEGGVGFKVTLTVVNTGNLGQPPEIQESFIITEATGGEWTVSFTLGVDNPLAQRFPYRLQWQNQCPYVYKGPRCKYAGPLATCDFTYFGANGCKAHNNQANYGGMLGLSNANGSSLVVGS